ELIKKGQRIALGKSAMLCRLQQVDEDRRGGCAVVDRVAGEDSDKIEPLAVREGKVLDGVDRVAVVRQVVPVETETKVRLKWECNNSVADGHDVGWIGE